MSFFRNKLDQGMVFVDSGSGCTGMVEVATKDAGVGTTTLRVFVTGSDLPGTVDDNAIAPGISYSNEVVTFSAGGHAVDNNQGTFYSVSVPTVVQAYRNSDALARRVTGM